MVILFILIHKDKTNYNSSCSFVVLFFFSPCKSLINQDCFISLRSTCAILYVKIDHKTRRWKNRVTPLVLVVRSVLLIFRTQANFRIINCLRSALHNASRMLNLSTCSPISVIRKRVRTVKFELIGLRAEKIIHRKLIISTQLKSAKSTIFLLPMRQKKY